MQLLCSPYGPSVVLGDTKMNATNRNKSRYKLAEEWVATYEGDLEEGQLNTLWRACDECRYLESSIADDAEAIAKDAAQFASRLRETGATHSAPCGYSRYDHLARNIATLEAKVEALFGLAYALLGEHGKKALREAMGAK